MEVRYVRYGDENGERKKIMTLTKKQFKQILIKELEDAFSMYDDPDWLGRAKEDTIPILKPSKKNPKEQPLRSELEKAGLPKNVINTIIRNIVKQLKFNKIKITESKLYQVVEGVLLEVSRAKRKKLTKTRVAATQAKKPIVQKVKGGAFTAQRADGEKKEFHQLAYGNSLKKAKEAATIWARMVKPVDSHSKGMPRDWITQGGTREEWGALSTEEKVVFTQMPKNKQPKFFKMSSEQRMELYKQIKTQTKPTTGGDPEHAAKTPGSKSDIGAEKTAAAQAAAGAAAAKEPMKDGEIRISALNQQLKTISPPADDKTRKIALSVVQKHLTPYLKTHGLKLSEKKLFADVADIILEAKKLKNKVN